MNKVCWVNITRTLTLETVSFQFLLQHKNRRKSESWTVTLEQIRRINKETEGGGATRCHWFILTCREASFCEEAGESNRRGHNMVALQYYNMLQRNCMTAQTYRQIMFYLDRGKNSYLTLEPDIQCNKNYFQEIWQNLMSWEHFGLELVWFSVVKYFVHILQLMILLMIYRSLVTDFYFSQFCIISFLFYLRAEFQGFSFSKCV